MKENLLFVGIDVDDKAYHVAVVDHAGKELKRFVCAPIVQKLVKELGKIGKKELFRICYEATYIGFSLQRSLKEAGICCDIIAPSLIPTLPGKKVKTDKLDSLNLARYYANDLLTKVHVPTVEQEADRDLVRSRSFVLEQIRAFKNHVTSYCKRLGWDYRTETKSKSYWTQSHRVWLDRKVAASGQSSLKVSLVTLLATLKSLEATAQTFNSEIEALAEKQCYKAKVLGLSCIRGIDVPSALSIVTELGDINRFDHPNRLTSYAGLDVIEHSSGGKERRFGISKMGNTHLRRVLVEACQFAIQPPRVSYQLEKRRQKAAPASIEIAERCMQRLHKKGMKLLYRDKARNKIKTACAREMLGFVWEMLRKAA